MLRHRPSRRRDLRRRSSLRRLAPSLVLANVRARPHRTRPLRASWQTRRSRADRVVALRRGSHASRSLPERRPNKTDTRRGSRGYDGCKRRKERAGRAWRRRNAIHVPKCGRAVFSRNPRPAPCRRVPCGLPSVRELTATATREDAEHPSLKGRPSAERTRPARNPAQVLHEHPHSTCQPRPPA